ncbi:MAG: hypothetical protein HN728_06270 [Flavobacteriales bacterium]|jgi:hypothetical protein|nr:hypothetical protein [Flavobacteriales bacterium]MBT6916020.1 hypothetical protein [Flavobacteriales bacterium]MBT7749427.1 hypothetical protein [Flavobacteriales bacterium]
MADQNKIRKSRKSKKRSPFPGLGAYTERDAERFVGRDRLKYPLLKKLSEDNFVSIQGANGVGKTSFVNCLILPELRAGCIVAGKSNWKIVSLKPGKNPLGELANALASADIVRSGVNEKIDPNLNDKFEDILRNNRYGLLDIVNEYDIIQDSNLLIFIDQLDELSSYSEAQAASTFIERLVEAAGQSAYPIHILTCSRSETDGDFAIFPRFAELLNRNHFLLAQLEQVDLMRIFENITSSGALYFRPGIIDRIADYYKSNPIELAKFQHAMRRSIDEVKYERGIKTIGPLHLKTIGGLNGSISNQLEQIFNSFDESDKETCRVIFQALTSTNKAGVFKTERRTLETLSQLIDKEQADLVRIIQNFVSDDCLALTVTQSSSIEGKLSQLDLIYESEEDRFTPSSEVEISRNIIIGAWPRLSNWVADEANDAAIYSEIAESATKKEHPYQGEKLKGMLAWFKKKNPQEGWALRYHEGYDAAIEFILKSEKLAIREAEIRKAEELSRQQKSARNKRIIAGILMVAVVLLVYSGFETRDAVEANQKAVIAEEKARISSMQAAKDSAEAAAAVSQAISAVMKADTSAKNAEEASLAAEEAEKRALQLRGESQRLSADVELKEGELKKAVIEMNKSRILEEYLNVISNIRENSEDARKILTRTEDQAQLREGAGLAKDGYNLFLKTKNAKYEGIRDSVQLVTEIAQKKLFSTMNLAIQKVNTSAKLSVIKGGVAIEKAIGLRSEKANAIYFIGTNDPESSVFKVHIVNGHVELAERLVSAYSKESKTQGIKTLSIANSKSHFLVSHLPTVQNVRFLTSYSTKGNILSNFQLENSTESLYPYRDNDFLSIDQEGSLQVFFKNESGMFIPKLIRDSKRKLRASDFNSKTNRAFLALDNREIEIVRISSEQETSDEPKLELRDFSAEITAVKFLPKQNWLVVGNRNGELYFYDAETRELIYKALNEHVNNVNCLELGPSETILVSGGRDKSVNIWKLDELANRIKAGENVEVPYQPIQFVETESIRDIAFVNNDWIVVVSSSEGLISNQSGGVSLLPLDFDVTGQELTKLLD